MPIQKGNGQDETNGLLRQMLVELGGIRKEQSEIRAILIEQGKTLKEHGEILRQHGELLRQHGVELHDLKIAVGQLSDNMGRIAKFIGEERALHDRELDDIRRRLTTLEQKAA